MGPLHAEHEVTRRDAWLLHTHAVEALRRVLGVFERERVDVLPVKGIILAHALYASVEERPHVDVDLRVTPRDLPRVERAVRREGWPTYRNSKQLGSRGIDVGGTLVEVETTIGPPGVCAVGVADMLRRSRVTTEHLGFEHREPELHDHALILCINVFKDKLGSAPWAIRDLERIVEVPSFEVNRMAALAAEARLKTLVWIVADWLGRRDGGPKWLEVRDALGRSAPRARYAARYGALARTSPSSAALSVLARAASDSAWLRAKALGLGAAGSAAYWLEDGIRRFRSHA